MLSIYYTDNKIVINTSKLSEKLIYCTLNLCMKGHWLKYEMIEKEYMICNEKDKNKMIYYIDDINKRSIKEYCRTAGKKIVYAFGTEALVYLILESKTSKGCFSCSGDDRKYNRIWRSHGDPR
eukprot:NODE_640_length_5666_cov_0.633196.p4 type:complete len:123 gc:universal NODE_640_length_5666_cov_0.633196:5458-5090(-)